MEYYLGIKKNAKIPFAAASVDVQNIIPSEVRQRQALYISCMWNFKKNDTNQLTYKTEIDS